MKIIDLLNDNSSYRYSLEFFPPKTETGIANLKKRVKQMCQEYGPIFIDITWRAGLSSAVTLNLASEWTRDGLIVNMHLTCMGMTKEEIDKALSKAQSAGIRNLVALRGDPIEGRIDASNGDFSCALDLIRYIREKHGDYFCLTVSGYPEGHPDQFVAVNKISDLSESERSRLVKMDDGKFYVCPDDRYWNDLRYLKSKIEAGGDLIITQLFFDCSVFSQFVEDCRSLGINCPILPGIMLIQNYNGFNRMTSFCKTRVPQKLRERLGLFSDGGLDGIKQFGAEWAQIMCQELAESAKVKHFHLYTLNKDEVANSVMEFLSEK